ncbi:hypothetical protein ACHAXT_001784 [Thalassiosira profunda]
MGRITIFSVENCNYCRRTKAAFAERGIPYADIDIESYPSKRSDMLALTDRMSVPQVFFNDDHIGGSEEALAVLAKWDEEIATGDGADASPRDGYVRLVESRPDPTDERLAIPTGPSAVKPVDLAASRSRETIQIDEKEYTTLELTKLLVQRMPRDSLSYWGCLYYNVFKGSDGVTALREIFGLESREEAVQVGLKLQRKHFLGHVCKDHPFGDSIYYFRLQPFDTPHILNSFRVWGEAVEDDPMHLIHRLGKLWGKLESRHLKDGLVDHATIRTDDLYWKFEEEVCELQRVSLTEMDDAAKTAFVINLYNLWIKYAFVKVGIPATNLNRLSFFDDVSVDVGGCILSFNDLEHGILRANTRHPYKLSKQFGVADSRKRLALKTLDPRIHFALNCGARSCPPVKKYTAEAIEEELRLSAMAFCEQENNVSVDLEARELKLSKILYWYMSDFAPSKSELPKKVVEYLRGEKKALLEKLMEDKTGRIAVKFLDYDWSSNDANFDTFERGHLSSKSVFPYSRNPPPQRYEMMA